MSSTLPELGAETAVPAVAHAPAVPTAQRPSRRAFVFLGALAATAFVPGTARAQAARRTLRPTDRKPAIDPGTMRPSESVAAPADWTSITGRLVRRATMGVMPAEMTRATEFGYQGYLNYQLNHTRINDDAVEAVVTAKWPLMSQTSDVLFGADSGTLRNQLQESTLYRAAFSQRQLYHRMVELWSDHFNQDYDKVGYLLVTDQRDVIRANALGTFPALLKASAHSASMMLYLDQQTSRATAPNQNYAREVMELHTLGVDGGYTQTDVAELSRVLSGWTFTGKGQFVFNPAFHDTGTKTVLGVTIAGQTGAAGINEGEQMLDVLAKHPSTAKFIATKMLRWLLDPNPTDAQVSTVASVYKATGGDIKSMIRVILNDSWLPASPMKLKRPFHFLASALRSTNPTVTAMSQMNSQLSNMGHLSYTWDTPDGYPDKIEYWAGNIVPRWAFAQALANLNSATTIAVDTKPYLAGSPDAAVEMIDLNFFAKEMPAATKTAMLAYLKGGTFNDARMRETLSLAIGANAFQWY